MLIIREFVELDILQASKMARDVWAYQLEGYSDELCDFIHEYMVRLYFKNRELAFGIDGEDGLGAFLLGSFQGDGNDSDEWFRQAFLGLEPGDRVLAGVYRDYLKENGKAVRGLMGEKDARVDLFVSRLKGCGAILMGEFERVCRERGMERLFLWTDTTCNFEFYDRNGFAKVREFEYGTVLDEEVLTTIVFSKNL